MAALGVGTTLFVTQEPLLVLGVLFVVIVPFERWFPRHQQPIRRPHLGTDLAWAVASGPLNFVAILGGIVLSIASFAWLPGLALRPLVDLLPPLPKMLVGIALFDLAIYWAHRFGHEVPFWWRFHRIHHSTAHLDWVSGFRNHPLDGILLTPAFVLLLVAGFSPEFSGALVVVQIVTGLFLHANVRWRWKPLHRIVITPEFHHWHHANERDAHCSNYSVFLAVWDILFGTYYMPEHRRPMVYGIDEPVSVGLAGQLVDPFRGLPPLWTSLRQPVQSFRCLKRSIGRGLRQMRASAQRPRRDRSVQSMV